MAESVVMEFWIVLLDNAEANALGAEDGGVLDCAMKYKPQELRGCWFSIL